MISMMTVPHLVYIRFILHAMDLQLTKPFLPDSCIIAPVHCRSAKKPLESITTGKSMEIAAMVQCKAM